MKITTSQDLAAVEASGPSSWSARKDFWSRSHAHPSNLKMVQSKTCIEGYSYGRPMVGWMRCSEGLHEWQLCCEGWNGCAVGVALESADFGVITSRNVAYWGIWLADREMEFAGKKMKRTRGPDAFSVPCMVTVRLDCDEGTMAVVAGEVDLGVVCDALPKRQGLRLAVATTSRKCRVVQEGYARLA